MKRLILALMVLALCNSPAWAQIKKFEIGANTLYSPSHHSTNGEISFDYHFQKSKVGIGLNMDLLEIGLPKTAIGENVSIFFDPENTSALFLRPEIGFGAIHGLFNGEGQPIATKFQLPIGVTAGYYLGNHFMCGLIAKYCIITGTTNVFLTGFRFAACF